MSQEDKAGPGARDFLSMWLKAADEWSAAGKSLLEPSSASPVLQQQDIFSQKLNSLWQAYFNCLNDTGTPAGKPASFPEIFAKAAEPFWTGIVATSDPDDKGKVDELKKLVRKTATCWPELFGKEFSALLNMPQLGLTRYYQEHAAQAIEKYNIFQSQLTQFINLLCEPLIDSIQEMRDEVQSARKEGEELVKDAKEQYQDWIRKLESEYLKLLKSPEYTGTLSSVLTALRDYKITKQQLLIDLLQDLPVPTHKDMDELYKEIYTLKKRVKELEKRGKKNG